MTARILVSRMIASNGGKKFSRSVRSEMLAGPDVGATLRLTMAGQVLERRKYLAVGQRQGVALQPPHGRDAELRCQVRVLAEGFLDASPARIAADIDHRRERLAYPARAHLAAYDRIDAPDQLGIEAAGQTNRLREMRPIHGRIAVQSLLVKPHRYAEPCLLECKMLNGVDQPDGSTRVAPGRHPRRDGAARIRRARETTKAIGVFGGGFDRIELQLLIEDRDLAIPDGEHLRHLLRKRHTRQQILHPCLHRGVGIAIERTLVGGAPVLGARGARGRRGARGACRSQAQHQRRYSRKHRECARAHGSVPAMPGDDAFGQLLPARTHPGLQALLDPQVRERCQAQ